jgi:circadian clock protein KaiB
MQLRLYVVGGAPNSISARANLAAILSAVPRDAYSLEVVDCLLEPHRALAEGVLVTPTLIRLAPTPVQTIIGSLSNRQAVTASLGLADGEAKRSDA